MAESFATTADLTARWRPLSTTETTSAVALLGDASAFIRAECPGIDAKVTAELLDAGIPRAVACAMVKRAMVSGPDLAGVTSSQETTGPFSQSLAYANPTGDLYLTKQERRHLGFGGSRAGNVPMADVDLYVEDV